MVLAVILSLICGILIGFVLSALIVASNISNYEQNEKRLKGEWYNTNEVKEYYKSECEELRNQVEQRDKLIDNQLNQLQKNAEKIIDLSNNLEFVYNNYKKELANAVNND